MLGRLSDLHSVARLTSSRSIRNSSLHDEPGAVVPLRLYSMSILWDNNYYDYYWIKVYKSAKTLRLPPHLWPQSQLFTTTINIEYLVLVLGVAASLRARCWICRDLEETHDMLIQLLSTGRTAILKHSSLCRRPLHQPRLRSNKPYQEQSSARLSVVSMAVMSNFVNVWIDSDNPSSSTQSVGVEADETSGPSKGTQGAAVDKRATCISLWAAQLWNPADHNSHNRLTLLSQFDRIPASQMGRLRCHVHPRIITNSSCATVRLSIALGTLH
eukprot:1184077-Prorocentrum_minimum.AAC.2